MFDAPATAALGRLRSVMRGVVAPDAEFHGLPKLAVTTEQAAWMLEMSVDTLQRTPEHELPRVRRGRLVRFRVRDLERYLESLVEP